MRYLKQILMVILVMLSISLFGCATSYMGYDIKMVQPVGNQGMSFSDENIGIFFKPSRTSYVGVEGIRQYENFDGMSFVLHNKTDEVLILDWNKISFKDYYGSSGNSVMHEGTKYKDCSSIKSSSTIPPKGKLSDIIIPCYGVKFISNRWETGWKVHMLPSPNKLPNPEFGFFIPIQIGKKIHNYNFQFVGTAIEKKW